MNSVRIWLALLIMAPAPSAWAIYCFDFEINNQPCLAAKTQALMTMMKLQNDPRFLTWTSEGQPGVKAAKDADRIMKMAQSCLTLIDCGAASAAAQKLAGSVPQPVKGDLGNFAGQIWWGADLPHGTLDQMFDNNRKTEELPFQKLVDGGYEPPNDPEIKPGELASNKPMQSGPLSFTPAGGASTGPDVVSLASAGAPAGSAAATAAKSQLPGPDAALRSQQVPSGVQYEGQREVAAGSWQASATGAESGDSGFNMPSEMEQRVGSAISDETDGLSDSGAPSAAKVAKLASSAVSETKKKAAVTINDGLNDKPKLSDTDAEPLSQAELASLIP